MLVEHLVVMLNKGQLDYTFIMTRKDSGIVIDCKSCRYLSSNDNGGFEVSVNISDRESGVTGLAVLLCEIEDGNHRVKLLQWQTGDSSSAQPNVNLCDRVSEVLDVYASKRLCGRCKLCPCELVQAIAQIA